MPQVPYSPIPSQGPADIPTPFRTDVGATPTAFGAGIGEAQERFGAQMEKASDVITTQVLANKDIANRAEQDKLDAEFMEKAGQEHQKFSAMQGGERAAYFPTYMQNLKAIRDDVRSRASNPMVQKMFDTSSLSTLGRTIFNGAGAAGSGAREDAIKSNALRQHAVADQANSATGARDADDLAKVAYSTGYHGAEISGISDEEARMEAGKKGASTVHRAFIEKLDREGEADMAQAEFDKRKGRMTQKDQDDVQDELQRRQNAVGATNEANRIVDAHRDKDGRLTAGQRELEAEGDKAAPGISKDPSFQKALKTQIGIAFHKEQAENHAEDVSAYNTIKTLIASGASSRQEIMANPQGEKALTNPWVKTKNVDAMIYQLAKARDKPYNDATMTDLAYLRKQDPYNFLLIDPTDPKLNLNYDNQIKIINDQRIEAKAKRVADPRPLRAMSDIQTRYGKALSDAGVIGRNKDEDTHNAFMSQLTTALEAWQDTHGGKVPTTEENYEIGKQLLNKINSGQTTWLGNPVMKEQFQVHEKPPESFRVTQPTDASDEDVQRAWDRKVLSEKFRPKSATPQMQKRGAEMTREKFFEGVAPIAPPVSE